MRAFGWLRPALLAGALALTTPAVAAEIPAEQRSQIEGVVRDYLVNNPEVLKEALAALEAHQETQERAAVAQAVKEMTAGDIPGIVVGNPDGDITLVEFFDYNCGYCKRALGDIEALVKADSRLRFVLVDFPILRQESVDAALVSIAASKQLQGDKLFRFHADLLSQQGVVGKPQALAAAKASGVDMAQLERDIASDAVRQVLAGTLETGEKLGISGTPSFVVGDGVLPGAVGVDTLKTVVASVRQCGKVTC
ncbi:DsbA family protein [Pseudochelatococcus contaminans]|uniref:Protein-disulfide isomerase n=1 Tax=Pseudochelatococcus contaminans TaxID=1538103 RepID=A0A7W6EGY7_9HYPH|nr:DsbA family protein [Pseudochelatococcus contaminans]MBB3809347.1 protein-disulfide isomerase [Pseudochelatococcus contaminans]